MPSCHNVTEIAEIVLWFFLILVQGQGPLGSGWGSKEACEAKRAELIQDEEVIALSECTPLKVTPREKAAGARL